MLGILYPSQSGLKNDRPVYLYLCVIIYVYSKCVYISNDTFAGMTVSARIHLHPCMYFSEEVSPKDLFFFKYFPNAICTLCLLCNCCNSANAELGIQS